jgi:WD40 repeat protein/tetratricopeptide (TPR) repeat protein
MGEDAVHPDDDPTSPNQVPPSFDSKILKRVRIAIREAGDSVISVPEAISGAMIGNRYKLLELIGAGGMGVVWMAEQRSPIRRLVAVKLIKAGMDSSAVLARFEAERQALAMMDHPNIARIFDAGTTDHGHPFFVMELVKGLPLTRYCDERKMPLNERLDLFVQACGAVQHAHQKGIIHRDLKPGNLLVTEHDGNPVPKVIDFGLVKALAGSSVLTEHTLHTSFGAVAGTPQYMAPEQVGINALDVDTRADIYALGVILYELLSGTTPHGTGELHQAAWDEMRRVIRDVDPPRPSLRVTQSKTLANLAATRHTEPARLSKLISGDLDWIVMKALEKDRHRRYGTASDLAADVQRHLTGEAVLAAPPTAAYRLRKFVRKHRVVLSTAAVILIVLIAGVLVSTWQAVRASRAEIVAQRETAEAKNQRIEAQRQKIEAQHQRETALKASKKAEDESATVQRQLADSYVQNGISAWAEHDPSLAALWFCKALKLDQVDPHRELMDRIRLGDCFRQCAWPSIATEPEDDPPAARKSGSIDQLMKESDGTLVVVTAHGTRFKVDSAVSSAYEIGDLLLLGSKDSAQLCDVKTGKLVFPTLAAPSVFSFEITDDHRFIVTNTWRPYTVLRIWDARTGLPVSLGSATEFPGVKLSPDGKLVAVSDGGRAQIWNLETLQPRGIPIQHPAGFRLRELNNAGKMLMNDGHDGMLVLNSTDAIPVGPPFRINGEFLAMNSDGTRVLVRATSGHFSAFDACTGIRLFDSRIAGPDPHFSKDGKWIIAGTLRWDTRIPSSAGSMLRIAYPPEALSLRLSPDGKSVATYKWNLRLWDAQTLQPIVPPELSTITGEITGDVAFIPNADELITILADRGRWRLAVRNIRNGRVVRIGAELRQDLSSLSERLASVSPDGKYVLVVQWAGSGNVYQVFSTQTLALVTTVKNSATIPSPWPAAPDCFSPDSRALVGWGAKGGLAAWDVTSGEVIPDPPHAWRALAAPGILCPDGRSYLCYADPPRILKLEDGTSLTPPFTSVARPLYSGTLALGPDASVVLTSLQNSIRLWDAHNAMAVSSALPCDDVVDAVVISRDGASALSLSTPNPNPDPNLVMPPILRRWSVAPVQFTGDDLEPLSELISGRKIDELSGIVPIDAKGYYAAVGVLLRLQRESPVFFASHPPPVAADVPQSYHDEVEARLAEARTPEQKLALAREWAYAGGFEVKSKLYKEAALLEEKSLSLDDSSLAARNHLAHAYACQGRFSDALAIYQKFAGQAYQTPAPWPEQGQVGDNLADLRDIWPGGNDDPGFQQLLALNQPPADPPATAPPADTQLATAAAKDAQRDADEAVAQFKLGHVQESHELLRKSLRGRRAVPDDGDTAAKLYSAQSLIDPPSTQPSDEFAEDLNTMAWDLVKNAGQSPEKYAVALDVVRHSVAISANTHNLGTLAAAQYRTGDYLGALQSIARSEATDFVAQESHASNLILSAMAQEKLGRHTQARGLLQRVIDLAKEPNALIEDERLIFDESAAMIDPASTQPATMPSRAP